MAEGLDGHAGDTFNDFTRGETLQFSFYFETGDVDPVTEEVTYTPTDVTGWKVYISFTKKRTCEDITAPDLEVTLLPQDATGGIISGFVTDDETFALPRGNKYASARYITASGETYIIDKAKRVYVSACVNPKREQ